MACKLVPINLKNPSEFAELQRQRTACGWGNTPADLALWREKQEAGLKSFFWITKPTTNNIPPSLSPSQSSSSLQSIDSIDSATDTIIRAGHISLDAYTHPADPELANEDKTNLTIQQFFILPEHRAGGLGRAAMSQIEALAPTEPYGSSNCEYVTLNTMSKEHFYDPVLGPYVRMVQPICNQEWYEKQGYVLWKVEGRYHDTLPDGKEVVFDAAFMRKKVVRE
ncbi:hypothetical protein BJY04DRAFT_49803 [Aspergillus karnatakaensis]|uniref:uncharacterized protein n=1 Tax=Aspergillus karnatakaensis TaxID=1810916 RepID=UPI003CCCD4F6